jgi:hypothetical protein
MEGIRNYVTQGVWKRTDPVCWSGKTGSVTI